MIGTANSSFQDNYPLRRSLTCSQSVLKHDSSQHPEILDTPILLGPLPGEPCPVIDIYSFLDPLSPPTAATAALPSLPHPSSRPVDPPKGLPGDVGLPAAPGLREVLQNRPRLVRTHACGIGIGSDLEAQIGRATRIGGLGESGAERWIDPAARGEKERKGEGHERLLTGSWKGREG